MSGKDKRWPGDPDKAFPEVFTTIPANQPTPGKPGQLTQKEVEAFFNDGFVLLEKFFDTESELEPVKKSIATLVDDLAQKLYKAGKITKLYQDAPLSERLTLIDKEFPGAMILLHKVSRLTQPMRDLWTNARLLNIMEQLLGTSDIIGHPVWNLRTKVPQQTAGIVPWHQDAGYMENCLYDVVQVTAWIPFLNATEKNGCMQMIKGGHRKGRVARHNCCWKDTWYIMMDEESAKNDLGVDLEKDAKTIPVPYGGLLLFNNIIPHRSLPNVSNEIRWSMDLRWQKYGTPVGLWNLKDAIQMRSSSDPNFKPDFEPFDAIDRTVVQEKFNKDEKEKTEFDTTIQGPWMLKWEITHPNRHTAAMLGNAPSYTPY